MSSQTDSDQVNGAQRKTLFLKKTKQNNSPWQPNLCMAVLRNSLHTHLQPFNKHRDVFGHRVCVFRCCKIIQIGSSVVPVHYNEIHVCPGQQQLCNVRQPLWWRPRGPVPVNEEGSRSGEVKLRVHGWVGVRHERPTGAIFTGVQQQPHSDAGSEEGVTEIQIYEVITPLIWKQKRR